MSNSKTKTNVFLFGIMLLPVLVAILFSVLKLFSPPVLNYPNVYEIYKDFFIAITDKSVIMGCCITGKYVLISTGISILIGVSLSFLLSANEKIYIVFEPTIDFLRSIPVTFFIPAVAAIFGIASPNNVWALAVFPCSLIVLVNIAYGIKQQNRNRLHHYRLLSGRHSRLSSFFNVTIFEIFPYFVTGLKVALSYSIVIVTVLEFMQMGNEMGLGRILFNEMDLFHYTRSYSLIIIVGLLGYLLNLSIEMIFYKWSNYVKN